MKIEWKACLRVGISAFVLFLAIYYWQGVAAGFKLFLSAASPLVIGSIIAYILNIPMSFYERRFFSRKKGERGAAVRRVISMIAAMVTVLGVIAGVVGLIIPELTECVTLLINTIIPDLIRWVAVQVSGSESLAEIIPMEYLNMLETVDWQKWLTEIISFLGTGIGGAVGSAVGAISSVFSSVVTGVLGLIFALYLLIGKDKLLNQSGRLMKSYLPARLEERISHVLTVLNDCFHRYVVGQCLEAVILGGLCILGMWIFRFPYATMIGTLVGFTALIPIAGAYIGAAVGAVMILTVSPIQAVLFVVFLIVLQQLEGNLIYPKVVGTSIGLPGIWVLAAITVGGGLMGISGMLIGVPLVAAAYRLIREDVRRREGKERAAVSRKRREQREKKFVKDVGETPKLKANTKVTVEAAVPKTEKNTNKTADGSKNVNANKTADVNKKSDANKKADTNKKADANKKADVNKTTNINETTGAENAEQKSSQNRKRRRKRHKSSGQSPKSGQGAE